MSIPISAAALHDIFENRFKIIVAAKVRLPLSVLQMSIKQLVTQYLYKENQHYWILVSILLRIISKPLQCAPTAEWWDINFMIWKQICNSTKVYFANTSHEINNQSASLLHELLLWPVQAFTELDKYVILFVNDDLCNIWKGLLNFTLSAENRCNQIKQILQKLNELPNVEANNSIFEELINMYSSQETADNLKDVSSYHDFVEREQKELRNKNAITKNSDLYFTTLLSLIANSKLRESESLISFAMEIFQMNRIDLYSFKQWKFGLLGRLCLYGDPNLVQVVKLISHKEICRCHRLFSCAEIVQLFRTMSQSQKYVVKKYANIMNTEKNLMQKNTSRILPQMETHERNGYCLDTLQSSIQDTDVSINTSKTQYKTRTGRGAQLINMMYDHASKSVPITNNSDSSLLVKVPEPAPTTPSKKSYLNGGIHHSPSILKRKCKREGALLTEFNNVKKNKRVSFHDPELFTIKHF